MAAVGGITVRWAIVAGLAGMLRGVGSCSARDGAEFSRWGGVNGRGNVRGESKGCGQGVSGWGKAEVGGGGGRGGAGVGE